MHREKSLKPSRSQELILFWGLSAVFLIPLLSLACLSLLLLWSLFLCVAACI